MKKRYKNIVAVIMVFAIIATVSVGAFAVTSTPVYEDLWNVRYTYPSGSYPSITSQVYLFYSLNPTTFTCPSISHSNTGAGVYGTVYVNVPDSKISFTSMSWTTNGTRTGKATLISGTTTGVKYNFSSFTLYDGTFTASGKAWVTK